jgi:hypothetical protein
VIALRLENSSRRKSGAAEEAGASSSQATNHRASDTVLKRDGTAALISRPRVLAEHSLHQTGNRRWPAYSVQGTYDP